MERILLEGFETHDDTIHRYETHDDAIHRYETNRLRNIARLFGHLLANDAVSWAVLQVIKMNEEATTSSSRILVKAMTQESHGDHGSTYGQ